MTPPTTDQRAFKVMVYGDMGITNSGSNLQQILAHKDDVDWGTFKWDGWWCAAGACVPVRSRLRKRSHDYSVPHWRLCLYVDAAWLGGGCAAWLAVTFVVPATFPRLTFADAGTCELLCTAFDCLP